MGKGRATVKELHGEDPPGVHKERVTDQSDGHRPDSHVDHSFNCNLCKNPI